MNTSIDIPCSDDHNVLKLKITLLQKELESKNQFIYDCKRQLAIATSLEGDYLQEIEMLQLNEKALITELQEKAKQLEEDIIKLREVFNLELLKKSELIESLDSEIKKKKELAKTADKAKLKNNKSEANRDKNLKLAENVTVCNNNLTEIQTNIDILQMQNAALEESNNNLYTELEHTGQNLSSKTQELTEVKNLINNLQEDAFLTKLEVESLKSKPLDLAKKGNSLFAEVEDSRIKMQENIQQMKKKYTEIKQDVCNKLKQMASLRSRNEELSNQLDFIKSYDEEYEKVIESQKMKVDILESTVEEHKQIMLEEKNFTGENLPSYAVEFANSTLKTKYNDEEKAREALNRESRETLKTFTAIQSTNTEMRERRRKAQQLKVKIEKLENIILEMQLQNSPTNVTNWERDTTQNTSVSVTSNCVEIQSTPDFKVASTLKQAHIETRKKSNVESKCSFKYQEIQTASPLLKVEISKSILKKGIESEPTNKINHASYNTLELPVTKSNNVGVVLGNDVNIEAVKSATKLNTSPVFKNINKILKSSLKNDIETEPTNETNTTSYDILELPITKNVDLVLENDVKFETLVKSVAEQNTSLVVENKCKTSESALKSETDVSYIIIEKSPVIKSNDNNKVGLVLKNDVKIDTVNSLIKQNTSPILENKRKTFKPIINNEIKSELTNEYEPKSETDDSCIIIESPVMKTNEGTRVSLVLENDVKIEIPNFTLKHSKLSVLKNNIKVETPNPILKNMNNELINATDLSCFIIESPLTKREDGNKLDVCNSGSGKDELDKETSKQKDNNSFDNENAAVLSRSEVYNSEVLLKSSYEMKNELKINTDTVLAVIESTQLNQTINKCNNDKPEEKVVDLKSLILNNVEMTTYQHISMESEPDLEENESSKIILQKPNENNCITTIDSNVVISSKINEKDLGESYNEKYFLQNFEFKKWNDQENLICINNPAVTHKKTEEQPNNAEKVQDFEFKEMSNKENLFYVNKAACTPAAYQKCVKGTTVTPTVFQNHIKGVAGTPITYQGCIKSATSAPAAYQNSVACTSSTDERCVKSAAFTHTPYQKNVCTPATNQRCAKSVTYTPAAHQKRVACTPLTYRKCIKSTAYTRAPYQKNVACTLATNQRCVKSATYTLAAHQKRVACTPATNQRCVKSTAYTPAPYQKNVNSAKGNMINETPSTNEKIKLNYKTTSIPVSVKKK